MNQPLEKFSRDYLLAPSIEVNKHRGEEAIMDFIVYEELVELIGAPIVGQVGGIHYDFTPSDAVLHERAAVPYRNHKAANERMALLLAK